MLLRTKKNILGLLETMRKVLDVISRVPEPARTLSDLRGACESILEQLLQESPKPSTSINYLKSVQNALASTPIQSARADEKPYLRLRNLLDELKLCFVNEIHARLNIVFFPYMASMWDSLESVYLAAAKDPDCVVKVVPIPYLRHSAQKSVSVYEGDRFPPQIPITHYSQYDLKSESPDIVFVHNIYDQYNSLTQVQEDYFTFNLKKYTDMLVYIPYHVTNFTMPIPGERRMAYNLPSIAHVDKVVLAGDFLKPCAVRDGVPEEKILTLGSPKFDAIFSGQHKRNSYLVSQGIELKGKVVFLLNTGSMFFSVRSPILRIVGLSKILSIPLFAENAVVVWRPHPLTLTSIEKYSPYLLREYQEFVSRIRSEPNFFPRVYLDETDDYIAALHRADVLISDEGSLLRTYLATGKPILFWGPSMPAMSLLAPEAFYYLGNKEKSWPEQVKDLALGLDPLAEKRRGVVNQIYANVDGTCGEKIFHSIKASMFSDPVGN